MGRPAPSVITYASRLPGARSAKAAATAGTWLCRAAATTGMPSMESTSASASMCSSLLPTSAWMLV